MSEIKTKEALAEHLSFTESEVLDAFQNHKEPKELLAGVSNLINAGHNVDAPLLVHDNWKIVLNTRCEPKETRPEMHEHWHDASLYLIGTNEIRVGDSLSDAFEKEPGSGEWRAGTIENEKTISVHETDLLFVPAGIPHQNYLSPTAAFLVLKIKKGFEHEAPTVNVLPNTDSVHHIRTHLTQ